MKKYTPVLVILLVAFVVAFVGTEIKMQSNYKTLGDMFYLASGILFFYFLYKLIKAIR